MISRNALLVRLLSLVDQVPLPGEYRRRRRGRPYVYPTRLMAFRHIRSGYALWRFLAQPVPEAVMLRQALFHGGPMPSRRTIERRLAALPTALEAEIAVLGQLLLERLQVWAKEAAAAAIDSAPFHGSLHGEEAPIPAPALERSCAGCCTPSAIPPLSASLLITRRCLNCWAKSPLGDSRKPACFWRAVYMFTNWCCSSNWS